MDEHIERYAEKQNALDADCLFQIDYVLDTSLVIGDEEGIIFLLKEKLFGGSTALQKAGPFLVLVLKR